MAATQFFQQQEEARSRTSVLVFLFLLGVTGVVLAMNGAVHFLALFINRSDHGDAVTLGWKGHLIVSLVTLGVILLGALWRQSKLGQGGRAIATLLGGAEVDRATQDPDERKLLNVVEEMAIASGIPVPPVFLLPEDSINAFAAGLAPSNAVIGVTRGCMRELTRDELQGVIAHEFSHVFNGDMRLNLRLIGILAGIQVIGTIGLGIMRNMGRTRHRSRSSKNSGQGLAAIFFFALAMTVIGYVGVFFARLIKAAISRQREFLADATAVQYTRNPFGIGGALMKIRSHSSGSKISERHAEEASHLFFGSAISSIFDTHPSLDERIRRVDPQILRKGLEKSKNPPSAESTPAAACADVAPSARQKIATAILAGHAAETFLEGSSAQPVGLSSDAIMNSIATPSAQHLVAAGQFLKSIPDNLRHATQDSNGAKALVFALLWHGSDPSSMPSDRGLPAMKQAQTFLAGLQALGPASRLPLLELALPSLKTMTAEDRTQFLMAVKKMIWVDSRCEPFEYAIFTILVENLARRNRSGRAHSLSAVSAEAAFTLSALANFGQRAQVGRPVEGAFQSGWAILTARAGLSRASCAARDACTPEAMEKSLRALVDLRPNDKGTFVQACAATVVADGTVTLEEYEFLHAICAVLEVPLPPLGLPLTVDASKI